MTAISVEGLAKRFGTGTVALDGVSFDVAPGEVVSLLGPSGCGKTTTLRCIAGLETPDSGEIRIAHRVVVGPGVLLPPEKRGASMVFQQYALWPHLTVRENVAFGLAVRRTPKQRTAEHVERALRTVRLWPERDRRISQLSGGQQQRVALARAIAFEPDLILFDEPLSNLDAKLRDEMRLELVELQRRYGFAAVYVTHDQMEAISLADRVIIMNQGRIEQVGPPQEIWSNPATPFVAEFIGETNQLAGVAIDGGRAVRVGDADLAVGESTVLTAGQWVRLYLPYSAVTVRPVSALGQQNTFRGTVVLASFQGYTTLVKLTSELGELVARVAGAASVAEGDDVAVHMPPDGIRCFPTESDQGLATPAGGRHESDHRQARTDALRGN